MKPSKERGVVIRGVRKAWLSREKMKKCRCKGVDIRWHGAFPAEVVSNEFWGDCGPMPTEHVVVVDDGIDDEFGRGEE